MGKKMCLVYTVEGGGSNYDMWATVRCHFKLSRQTSIKWPGGQKKAELHHVCILTTRKYPVRTCLDCDSDNKITKAIDPWIQFQSYGHNKFGALLSIAVLKT